MYTIQLNKHFQKLIARVYKNERNRNYEIVYLTINAKVKRMVKRCSTSLFK